MKGSEFIKRIQQYGKKHGIAVEWIPERGKGSHGTLYLGSRKTIVRNPKDELKIGTLHAMLKQLNLSKEDIYIEMTMYQFMYPVILTPDNEDGGFVVTCRDLPEAITQGNSVEECLTEAADCLEEALAGRIRREETISLPSACLEGEYLVNVPIHTAMKAALYLSIKEAGISKFDFARQLHVDEKEIFLLLDPLQESNLPLMERALIALGRHAELRVV